MTKPSKDISWKEILVKFQTAGIMPAPYSYFYTVALRPGVQGMGVELTLRYLDRDELDEESILDEGFTLDDDYAWHGTLPTVWQQELSRMIHPDELTPRHNYTENDNFIEVVLTDPAGQSESWFPKDEEAWNYFQHELLQAIYEASDKENPFIAEYMEVDGRNELRISLLATFEDRVLTMKLDAADPVALPWTRTREIMETIFRADFIAEYAQEKNPSQNGTYLSIGDGLWYKFGDSLVEPAPKAKVLPQIIALFDQLREEVVR